MKKIVSSAVIGVLSGLILAACGGGSSDTSTASSQLLANGEACNAAWSSTAAYSTGAGVSYGGRNYAAAFWTQGNNPSTSSGVAGSGQPWTSGFTCGSGGATTTTTVAGTTTTTAAGTSSFVVSSAQFDAWFPNRNAFYTYADLITAMSYYPTFAKSGNATLDKQEAAAFFANLQHESDQLRAVREYNTANYGLYCDTQAAPFVRSTCVDSQWIHEYFGRGPIQISWGTNYRNLGAAMGMGTQLYDNPELLSTNASIAWRSALWYWMTQTGRAARSPHASMVGSYGFGQTIMAINGNLECVGGSGYIGTAPMQTRVNYYTTFTGNLGVATGSNLTC